MGSHVLHKANYGGFHSNQILRQVISTSSLVEANQ